MLKHAIPLALVASVSACGGGSPSAPSGEGVLVDGLVIGGAAALPFRASAGSPRDHNSRVGIRSVTSHVRER